MENNQSNQENNCCKVYGGEELPKILATKAEEAAGKIFLASCKTNGELQASSFSISEKALDLMDPTLHLANDSKFIDIIYPSFEYQYAQSLRRIMKHGIQCKNRTGIDTLAVQHQYFHIQDITQAFPLLRGKKVYPKMALKEVIWMLFGKNDLKWLNDRKVTYWNEWEIKDEQSAEKFDLGAEWIGTIGKSYGYQYRNFNGFDQVEALLKEMKINPMGRRHIINLWNSSELNQMALPPCMYDFHFECTPTEKLKGDSNEYYSVDLHAHVRSNDSFLGAPYDFMFCGWLLTLICNYLNQDSSYNDGGKYYSPRDIHYTADNYHLYVNHIEAAKQYLANVDENLNQRVSSPSIIGPCFLDDWMMHSKCLTIDEYLQMIDTNMKHINIQWCRPNPNNDGTVDEYGPIRADIAV